MKNNLCVVSPKEKRMFDHEKLDVYKASIEFVRCSYRLCDNLKGLERHARDQLLRASLSIPLNIAESNGKLPSADRRRFLRIALGSALECAATLDVLTVCEAISPDEATAGKDILLRIVQMLTKMTGILDHVREVHENEMLYQIDSGEE